MNNDVFYGTTNISSLSYLEFGAIDLIKGSKTVWDFRLNQKAYDWLMLARYGNDMAAYLDMTDAVKNGSVSVAVDIYRSEIHHHDDFSVNLGKLIALSVAPADNKGPSFFELGQTLFGCIEGMEFCKALLEKMDGSLQLINPRHVAWYGVDISHLFNRFAILMHPDYAVSVYDDIGKLPARSSIFFAKGVTLLYAIRSIDALFDVFNHCDAALFDYSLSVHDIQEVTIGTGKTVRYLPLDDFMSTYSRFDKKIYVKIGNSQYDKETDRLFIDAIWGTECYCEEYIALDSLVRKSLSVGCEKVKDAELLLDNANGRNIGWILLEEFVKTIIQDKE